MKEPLLKEGIKKAAKPKTLPYLTSGTVIELSAIFVLIITLRQPSGAGRCTSSCKCLAKSECNTRIFSL